MKKITLTAFAMVALAMAGCATNKPAPNHPKPPHHGHSHHHGTQPHHNAPHHSIQQFSCDVGLDVAVKHLGNDQIELATSDGKRAILSRAVSGSGERYVSNQGLWGNGGEWHQKGGEAYFEYVGVHGGQPKSTSCMAK